MGTPENHSKIKDSKVKIELYQGRPQIQHHRNNPAFNPSPKFTGECRSLKGQTFSGNRSDDFKALHSPVNLGLGLKAGLFRWC